MSRIDTIYVYNKHQSPVSALCFGRFYDQSIIVTGSSDGELHILNLINFTTLAKIQVHQSKIMGLEYLKLAYVNQSNKNMNDNQKDTHEADCSKLES